ncbi:MAG: flagellar biosynthesis repressor FlbT [Henriciella sp.]
MPLKLSLKPGEAVVVNGAVLRNGDRRGTVLLENHARVLREKDVLQPESVNTAGERAYFAIMQLYLMGEHDGVVYDQVASALAGALSSAETDEQSEQILDISRACAAGETYQALSLCRKYMKQNTSPTEAQNG